MRSNWASGTMALIALAMAMSVPPWMPASAVGEHSVTSPQVAHFANCDDQVNFFSVPIKRVQIRDGDPSNDRVPEAYTPRPDLLGNTVLAISELRCGAATVSGATFGPVSMAFANIELLAAPEGSEDDVLIADVYQLFFSTNSEPLADWFRAGTGLEAYHVPEMAYGWTAPEQFGELATFEFNAPAPRRWAFAVTGEATKQRRARLRPEGHVWQDKATPDGRIWRTRFASLAHDNYVVRAERMTVRPTPGSVLHEIMFPGDRPDDEPYEAEDPFPLSGFIPEFELVKTTTIMAPSPVREVGQRRAAAPSSGTSERLSQLRSRNGTGPERIPSNPPDRPTTSPACDSPGHRERDGGDDPCSG